MVATGWSLLRSLPSAARSRSHSSFTVMQAAPVMQRPFAITALLSLRSHLLTNPTEHTHYQHTHTQLTAITIQRTMSPHTRTVPCRHEHTPAKPQDWVRFVHAPDWKTTKVGRLEGDSVTEYAGVLSPLVFLCISCPQLCAHSASRARNKEAELEQEP